ncbi:homeobox protein 5 isoform X3 [Hydra vulgaris]|uniref:Homeobox protein 5 isoform X3 n=1 Tax=Hydra vulgaris TaxID=6087 RepID=A0ABM4DIY9_HYDVU
MQERQIISEQPKISEDEKKKLLAESETSFYYRRRIQIKGLPTNVSEEQVAKILLTSFNYNNIYKDANNTVHILFSVPEQAQKAISQFNGKLFNNQAMAASYSQSTFMLYVGNLAYDCSLEKFRELASQCGAIERIFLVYDKKSGLSKGYGFVEYVNQADAETARTKLVQESKEKKLKIDYAPSGLDSYDKVHSTSLCVENFPPNTSVDEIKELLSSEAKIVFCQIIGDSALVDVETVDEADKVWSELDGSVLGGSLISISFLAPLRTAKSTLLKDEVEIPSADSNDENKATKDTANSETVNPLSNKFQKQATEKVFTQKQPLDTVRTKFEPRGPTGTPNRNLGFQSGHENQNQHVRMGNQNQQMRPGNFNQQGRPGNPNQFPRAGNQQPRSGNPNFRPGNPNQQNRPGNPNQQNRPGNLNQQNRPENPNQLTRPGNPNQQTRPGNPNQQNRPENPGHQTRPGNPNQQIRPGNPNQQNRPGNPNQQIRPDNSNQQTRPGNPNQQYRHGNPNLQNRPDNLNPQNRHENPNQQNRFGNPNQQNRFGNPNQQNRPGNPNQSMWSDNQGHRNQNFRNPNSPLMGNQKQRQNFGPGFQPNDQRFSNPRFPGSPNDQQGHYQNEKFFPPQTHGGFHQNDSPNNFAQQSNHSNFGQDTPFPSNKEPLGSRQQNSKMMQNQEHRQMLPQKQDFQQPKQQFNQSKNLLNQPSNSLNPPNSWNNANISNESQNYSDHQFSNSYSNQPSSNYGSSNNKANQYNNPYQAPNSNMSQTGYGYNMADQNQQGQTGSQMWGNQNYSQNSQSANSSYDSSQWNSQAQPNFQNSFQPDSMGQPQKEPPWLSNNQQQDTSASSKLSRKSRWGPEQNGLNPAPSSKPEMMENKLNYDPSHSSQGYQAPAAQTNNQTTNWNQMQGYPMQNTWTNPGNDWNQSHSQSQKPDNSQVPTYNVKQQIASSQYPQTNPYNPYSIGAVPSMPSQSSVPPAAASQQPPSQPNANFNQQGYPQAQMTNKTNTAPNMAAAKYPAQAPGSMSMNAYSSPSVVQTGYSQTGSASTIASGYAPTASGALSGVPTASTFPGGVQSSVVPCAVPVVSTPVPNPAAQQYIQYYQQWYASQMATNTPEYASLMGQVSSFANQYFSQGYGQAAALTQGYGQSATPTQGYGQPATVAQSYSQSTTLTQSQTVVTQAVNPTLGSTVQTSTLNSVYGSVQSTQPSTNAVNTTSAVQAQSSVQQQLPAQGYGMQWQQQMQSYQTNQLPAAPAAKSVYTPAVPQSSQAVPPPQQAAQNSAAAVYYQESQGYSQQNKRPRY